MTMAYWATTSAHTPRPAAAMAIATTANTTAPMGSTMILRRKSRRRCISASGTCVSECSTRAPAVAAATAPAVGSPNSSAISGAPASTARAASTAPPNVAQNTVSAASRTSPSRWISAWVSAPSANTIRTSPIAVPAANAPTSAGVSRRASTSVCPNVITWTAPSASTESAAPRRRTDPSAGTPPVTWTGAAALSRAA